jgi:hypothetical protein
MGIMEGVCYVQNIFYNKGDFAFSPNHSPACVFSNGSQCCENKQPGIRGEMGKAG